MPRSFIFLVEENTKVDDSHTVCCRAPDLSEWKASNGQTNKLVMVPTLFGT